MISFSTYLFLIFMVAAEIPVLFLIYFLYDSVKNPKDDYVGKLSRTLFYWAVSKAVFLMSQFTLVSFTLFAIKPSEMTAAILVDGSLGILALANWYTFFVVWRIANTTP